jgi:glycosyltransferase involved in cell wall biosynthesis
VINHIRSAALPAGATESNVVSPRVAAGIPDASRRPGTRAHILEVTAYPPPRSGWAVRVEFLKQRLEQEGHECVVLNLGPSRAIPSPEYETVLGGRDLLRKLWRYSRRGFVIHSHANGDAIKGVTVALIAQLTNLVRGRRPFLTFHAGAIQRFFPRHRGRRFIPLYWLLFTIPRKVICNSEAVKRHIQGYGIPARKIAAIPAFTREYLEFTPTPLPDGLEAFLKRYPSIVFTYARMRPLFYPLTMLDGMARVMSVRPDVGLILCGGLSHMEASLWREVQARIEAHGLKQRICFVEDLDHDAFLTAMTRSTIYLRTPITDGVASSVLEALALRVPVVACENGTRPAGVITYPAEDAEALSSAVLSVLDRREEIVTGMPQLDVGDTLTEEVALLTETVGRGVRAEARQVS